MKHQQFCRHKGSETGGTHSFKWPTGLGQGQKWGRTERECNCLLEQSAGNDPKLEGPDRGGSRGMSNPAPKKLGVHIHLYKEQSDAKGGQAFFINPHSKVVLIPRKAASLRLCFIDLYIHSLTISEPLFSARCCTVFYISEDELNTGGSWVCCKECRCWDWRAPASPDLCHLPV